LRFILASNRAISSANTRVLQAETQRRMIFNLSDGTKVEYHVPTPADAAAAVTATSDDSAMFVSMIRLAVVNADGVLEQTRTLADPVAQTTLLGTEAVLAALRAQARLWTT
jgi:hypothetical protein